MDYPESNILVKYDGVNITVKVLLRIESKANTMAMHLKGNWLDKSFFSFIDFLLQD